MAEAQDVAKNRASARLRVVAMHAHVSHDSHSLLRILTDAGRLSLILRRITVRPCDKDPDTHRMLAVFEIPESCALNAAALAARFSRHVGISGMTCRIK
ncbi:MAG: hypothetical protein ACRYFY_20730 [Janthinobacterium lividum]